MRRVALAAIAAALAATWSPPARAAVCTDPVTYLIVCCPKPCQVIDILADAERQSVTAQEVILLGKLFAQTAQMLQQIEGLAQAVMNVGKAGVTGLSNPFHTVPVQYGPLDPNMTAVDRYASLAAIYAPDMGTQGPTSYGRDTYGNMRRDLAQTRIGSLAYAMNVRQYEAGATPQGAADITALAKLVTNAQNRREDVQARGFILLQIMQETQFRLGLQSRLTEMAGKTRADGIVMDMTPDLTRQ